MRVKSQLENVRPALRVSATPLFYFEYFILFAVLMVHNVFHTDWSHLTSRGENHPERGAQTWGPSTSQCSSLWERIDSGMYLLAWIRYLWRWLPGWPEPGGFSRSSFQLWSLTLSPQAFYHKCHQKKGGLWYHLSLLLLTFPLVLKLSRAQKSGHAEWQKGRNAKALEIPNRRMGPDDPTEWGQHLLSTGPFPVKLEPQSPQITELLLVC